jgi:hypothetical protein
VDLKGAIHVPAGITREVLKIHLTRYLRGIYVGIACGIYTVSSSNIRQIRGIRCSFWWWGVVVSSSFVCGALAFLFILSFSLRALSSRLERAPSAVVFIAMNHGCAHTDKFEMLLKISNRSHDDVTLFCADSRDENHVRFVQISLSASFPRYYVRESYPRWICISLPDQIFFAPPPRGGLVLVSIQGKGAI